MNQRQTIESKLALYDELEGILGAMRSFALAELRRIEKRETSQRQVVENLQLALDDLSSHLPPPTSPASSDIWLMLGSVRGFCGSFNEDIIRCWTAQAPNDAPLIVVGERLQGLLAAEHALEVAGADGGNDAPEAIDRILAGVMAIESRRPNQEFGLVACIRDESTARIQRLWPLPTSQRVPSKPTPITLGPAGEVVAGVARHYLYHSLLALLLRSIRVENHMRLLQMENALHHLQDGYQELERQRNRLRQEEIVQEIELMVGRR